MKELFENLISEPFSGILYHYTSLDALTKIVESKTIHASEAHYLNDSAEVTHLSDSVDRVLDTRPQTPIIRQLREWLKIRKQIKPLVFVVSFSEAGNLLSQWRSYCPPWQGVSIGFEASKLAAKASTQGFSLVRCIYDNESKAKLATNIADAFLARAESRGVDAQQHPSQSYFTAFFDLEDTFLRLCCAAKHITFSEEREWRLISRSHINYVDSDIKYRTGRSALIPYLELDLPLKGNKPSIYSATLGPTPNVQTSTRSLDMYLEKNADSTKTMSCGIPYRDY